MNLVNRALARTMNVALVRFNFVPTSPRVSSLITSRTVGYRVRLPDNHPAVNISQSWTTESQFGISQASLFWLWNHLIRCNPKTILEMGSGKSTALFAEFVSQKKAGGEHRTIIVSIDESLRWIRVTSDFLEARGLNHAVKFLHCRAESQSDSGTARHGYLIPKSSLHSELEECPVDLLLIDGPSGGLGRRQTLPSVIRLLAPRADIFLDDALRPMERATVKAWRTEFPDVLEFRGIMPLGKGLAWFRKKS